MLIREKAVRNLEETVVNNSTIFYELLVLLLHFTLANRTASIHIGRAEWFCGNARCKVSRIRAVRPSCVPADDPAPGLTSYDDSDPESPPSTNAPVSRSSTTKIVSRKQEVQDVCASLLLSPSRTSLGRDGRRNDSSGERAGKLSPTCLPCLSSS
jgi:hypothetical protein